VWYDEKGLRGGAQWVSTIEHELEHRDVFAIILTPESQASEWVQREYQLALAAKRKIVPILLKPTQVTGFLRTIQHITAIGVKPDAAAKDFEIAVPPGQPLLDAS